MVAIAAGGGFVYASYAGLYGASTGLRLLAHRIAAPKPEAAALALPPDKVAVALPQGLFAVHWDDCRRRLGLDWWTAQIHPRARLTVSKETLACAHSAQP